MYVRTHVRLCTKLTLVIVAFFETAQKGLAVLRPILEEVFLGKIPWRDLMYVCMYVCMHVRVKFTAVICGPLNG
jgi:hypothetical protein